MTNTIIIVSEIQYNALYATYDVCEWVLGQFEDNWCLKASYKSD
jgi:hypothetical protein